MQTFVPLSSVYEVGSVLDRRRLPKQLVEVVQIDNAIITGKGGWVSHPAVLMWKDDRSYLVYYGVILYDEWQRRWKTGERGGSLWHKSGEEILKRYSALLASNVRFFEPVWWGDERVHSSHRSCLLAKDFEHYSKFGWTEEPTPPVNGKWPYYWPVQKETA